MYTKSSSNKNTYPHRAIDYIEINESIAKKFRQEPTPQEKALLSRLKEIDTYFHFQEVIDFYIADFCSHDAMIIIELDGFHHRGNKIKDNQRDQYFRKLGYKVLHFWNSEIDKNINEVLHTIKKQISLGKKIPR